MKKHCLAFFVITFVVFFIWSQYTNLEFNGKSITRTSPSWHALNSGDEKKSLLISQCFTMMHSFLGQIKNYIKSVAYTNLNYKIGCDAQISFIQRLDKRQILRGGGGQPP